MLKIHKGLKKKKKDKKNKHKEDELFNEEELEKYRKEHSSKSQAVSPTPLEGTNSVQSDEWQKFKALTAGVDTILQKTQEDLDRIKSTSFFQRKPPPSEVEQQKEEERKLEEEIRREQDETVEEKELESELEKFSEPESDSEEEVDDNIFDTSYVDAVASGELKLAYIPDSPDKEQEEFDPFDTSIADKFIENNPKKRYLNLGCAVEVLSGKSVGDKPSLSLGFEKKSPRRRIKPVDLLLASFDEGDRPEENNLKDKTPIESPVKTLLDEEDPLFVKSEVHILSVAPITITPVNPVKKVESPQQKKKLDLSDFEVSEFDTLRSVNLPVFEKQASAESADDEFAQLAAESLARKTSVTPIPPELPISRGPLKSFEAVTPTDFIPVDPLQPVLPEEREIDPFDTSIVDKLILPGKQEIKLLEKELLSDIKEPKKPATDDIDDDDFDPRAGEHPTKAIRPQKLVIKIPPVEKVLSPSQKQDFLKIEEHDIEVSKPLTPLTANCEPLNDDDYDPFDTSCVNGLPGKLELKLIEKELIHQRDSLEDDDFNPRKYESTVSNETSSITDKILNKYSVRVNKQETLESQAIDDILTGKEEPIDISYKPVEPAKYEDPTDLGYIDPFDTSIADNIKPGKTELKLLETELITKN